MKSLAEPASLLQPVSLAEQMIKIISSLHCSYVRSRDDSVGIATDYGLTFGFDSRQYKICHLSMSSRWAHTASYPGGTWGSFPGVQRPGCESDDSPPSSAEVKSGGATSVLPRVSSLHRA
jgi:hypothetical protein